MKKAIWTFAVIIASIVVIAAVMDARISSRNGSPHEIRIAAVLGLTGNAADDSLGVKRGIDLAVADLAARGINVDLRYEDDKTDPKQTVSAVAYLASTDEPDAIIGPIWSFLEDAATPILTKDRILSYAPADTSEFTAGGPYMLHGAVKNGLIAAPAAQWLADKKATKVAIIVSKDGWGESVASAFRDAVAKSGGSVVFSDAIVSNDGSASMMALDIAKAKSVGAEAMLFTGYDDEDVALVERRSQLGFMVPVLAHTREFRKLLSAGTVTNAEMKGVDHLAAEESSEFVAKFRKAYGSDPGDYSDRAYDGTMMLVDAIQHASSTDGADLVSYIRSHPYDGYGGTYRFDEKGDISGGSWVIKPVVE